MTKQTKDVFVYLDNLLQDGRRYVFTTPSAVSIKFNIDINDARYLVFQYIDQRNLMLAEAG